MERRLLIVDDDTRNLRLYSRILVKGGYALRSVESGTLAIQALATEGLFDLLILDLCMPEPNGFDVMKYVRQNHPGLRILVVSGYLNGELLEASECLGATATLHKSEAPGLLLSRVNQLLLQ